MNLSFPCRSVARRRFLVSYCVSVFPGLEDCDRPVSHCASYSALKQTTLELLAFASMKIRTMTHRWKSNRHCTPSTAASLSVGAAGLVVFSYVRRPVFPIVA
jgi:hypothetical protein